MFISFFTLSLSSQAQEANSKGTRDLSQQARDMERLERKVHQLDSDLKQLKQENRTLKQSMYPRFTFSGDAGPVLFLFGAFCARWAQNAGRNSWLWFFLGLLFSIITVLFVLASHADDRRNANE
jgi:hypothetical protein